MVSQHQQCVLPSPCGSMAVMTGSALMLPVCVPE
jgi:hypothetical protein